MAKLNLDQIESLSQQHSLELDTVRHLISKPRSSWGLTLAYDEWLKEKDSIMSCNPHSLL
ncbi:MAG TPA: hypothetical protein VMW10_12850 [Alphaproteobacteria bacterium]|nr:hypothetical protein [Alphaproteobacteria bacterium]